MNTYKNNQQIKIHRAFICGFSLLKLYFLVLLYWVAGAVVLSIFILILSGFVVDVTAESVVDVEDCILFLSTAAESELLDDIDDSFVPQLTAINPKPILSNKNFFIIFIL
ncbi:hypothetical protein AMQ68_07315 [Chryseobacterium sp. ERMR1:04]|nr:hypothetical protein AMQ68_07315 [Chryseobacterium sp. ERMR1:04]